MPFAIPKCLCVMIVGVSIAAGYQAQAPKSDTAGTPAAGKRPVTPASKPLTPQMLQEIALRAISSDGVLGRPRVLVDSTTKTLRMDISPTPMQFIAVKTTRTSRLLEQAVRIEVLRRDLKKALGQETFWQAPVVGVDEAIRKTATSLTTATAGALSPVAASGDPIEASFEALQDATKKFGDDSGWTVDQTRDIATGFRVKVVFLPERAHVFVMPFTAYLLSQKPGQSLDSQWVEIFEGPRQMSGKYHFKAVWPRELHGAFENNFDVTDNDQEIKFTPQE
jgi:hypothetical protein